MRRGPRSEIVLSMKQPSLELIVHSSHSPDDSSGHGLFLLCADRPAHNCEPETANHGKLTQMTWRVVVLSGFLYQNKNCQG